MYGNIQTIRKTKKFSKVRFQENHKLTGTLYGHSIKIGANVLVTMLQHIGEASKQALVREKTLPRPQVTQ